MFFSQGGKNCDIHSFPFSTIILLHPTVMYSKKGWWRLWMRAFGNETFILVFLFPSLRVLEGLEVEFKSNYRKVANRSTSCYSGNLVFGGATNRDMSLNETCFYSNTAHTRSSWTDFNHGLVVHPQGCQGCQKIQKNILKINLFS